MHTYQFHPSEDCPVLLGILSMQFWSSIADWCHRSLISIETEHDRFYAFVTELCHKNECLTKYCHCSWVSAKKRVAKLFHYHTSSEYWISGYDSSCWWERGSLLVQIKAIMQNAYSSAIKQSTKCTITMDMGVTVTLQGMAQLLLQLMMVWNFPTCNQPGTKLVLYLSYLHTLRTSLLLYPPCYTTLPLL